MTGTEALLDLAREGLLLAALLAAPVVLATLIAGIVTGLITAITQVQDPAVGLVPRLAGAGAAIILVGPSTAHQLVVFAQKVFALVPAVGAWT